MLSAKSGCGPVVRVLFIALALGMSTVASVVTATPAAAAGSCSIRVPAKVAIANYNTRITAYLGADCAASGMSTAAWRPAPDYLDDFWQFSASTVSAYYTYYSGLAEPLGRVRATLDGAHDSTGNSLPQNSPYFVVKYATWAYSASSRQGHVVYINGLVHQWAAMLPGMTSPGGRTVILQRYLDTGWQNMITRTTNSHGQVTVGYIQPGVFQYRWVVLEKSDAWGTHSGSTFR